MATGKTLLEQVQELNEKKQSQAVIDMLSDAILQTENSAQLYAEKAQAYGRLKKLDLCDKMADISLAINKKNAKANHCKGNISLEQKKYTQSLEYYQTAIDADATYCYPLNGMGNVYLELEDYDNALVYYLKAIELCNKEAGYYHGVGNVYNKREDYPNAIKYYEKAISIDDKFIIAYNGLGIVYKNSKLHEQAFSNFQKAMDIAPDYSAPFFNRALLYEETGELDKAITDYKAYIEHTPNKTDFYVGKATEKVVKLTKMIENPAYGAIIKLINQIKRLLQFEDDYVTHYTGLGTTKILVLNAGSKFRLSEGAFLNDTSEGKELFTYLGFSASMPNNDGGTSLLFNKKPFIGSFVSNQKANDLTLWRMYGKEEKEEAKGCSITIDQKALLRAIKKQLLLGAQNNIGVKDNEMFSFYKVAYRAPEGKFILPGATEEEVQTLNNHIKALKEKINEALTQANSLSKIQQDILPDLNEIVYLFKTVEYQHEQEVRLVFNGFDFEKQLNTSANPLRVFIELVDIRPLIQKITIGPKVERGDEWAAAFSLQFGQRWLAP